MNKEDIYIKSKRKLKCLTAPLKTGEYSLHPITLEFITNETKNDFCLSETYFEKNQNEKISNIYSKYGKTPTELEIRRYMALPYVGFGSSQILNLYEIDTIGDLNEWVQKNVKESFTYINRIIKIFIIDNILGFKKSNDYTQLVTITKLVLENHKKIDTKHSKINKYITDYIKYWFQNFDENKFDNDIISDINNYLKKKLNKN